MISSPLGLSFCSVFSMKSTIPFLLNLIYSSFSHWTFNSFISGISSSLSSGPSHINFNGSGFVSYTTYLSYFISFSLFSPYFLSCSRSSSSCFSSCSLLSSYFSPFSLFSFNCSFCTLFSSYLYYNSRFFCNLVSFISSYLIFY